MKRTTLIIAFFLISVCILTAQTVSRNIKTKEYLELQENLGKGWNTWYNNSVISYVLLLEDFSINLGVSRPGKKDYLREVFKASKISNRLEEVKLGLSADYGSYTRLELKYLKEVIEVQNGTDGSDELILVSPKQLSKNQLIVETGLLWGHNDVNGLENNKLIGKFPLNNIHISTKVPQIKDAYIVTSAHHMIVSLENEVGIHTGKKRFLDEIKSIISKKRAEQEKRISSYDDLSGPFKAMQSILVWNTTYDAPNNRVISPVSRNWNVSWGGFVLFDWDTYFASYMCSLFNKNLAYANAIEITKAITPSGFFPNFQAPFGYSSWDRSQSPIGSKVILAIFNRYHEKWFLLEVYDELLTWNRWRAKNLRELFCQVC